MIDSPIFLVGAERSGTTLLRLMLDSHPSIRFFHEFVYVVDYIEDGKYPDIEKFRNQLELDRVFQDSNLKISGSDHYIEIVRDFLEQINDNPNNLIVGATVHRKFNYLIDIWPNARFIHIVRDPRDVANSYIAKGWAGNSWHAVDAWLHSENLWDRLVMTLDSDRFINIKYEDLIVSPEKVLHTICSFLHVDFSNEMFSYQKHTTFSHPDKNLITQWKEKSTDQNIKIVESRTRKFLELYGYEKHSGGDHTPSPLLIRYFNFDNRVRKLFFSLKRYGCTLRTLDFISRKIIKNQRFRVKVKRKLDSIDRKYIK